MRNAGKNQNIIRIMSFKSAELNYQAGPAGKGCQLVNKSKSQTE